MANLSNVFRSGKEFFLKNLSCIFKESEEFDGLLDKIDDVLLLGDRIIQACKHHRDFREINDFAWLLHRVIQSEGHHLYVEGLLFKTEIWLKALYFFTFACDEMMEDKIKLSSLPDYGALPALLQKLNLLSYEEIDQEWTNDEVRNMILLARKIRIKQAHYTYAPPTNWLKQMTSSALTVIIAPIFRNFDQIQYSLGGHIISEFPANDYLHQFQHFSHRRLKHLQECHNKKIVMDNSLLERCMSSKKKGTYLLLAGESEWERENTCWLITELLIKRNSWWLSQQKKVQEWAPWLPGTLVHVISPSQSPIQITRSILLQAYTLLLENNEICLADNDDMDVQEQIKAVFEQLVKERGQVVVILISMEKLEADEENLRFFPKDLPARVTVILTVKRNSWMERWFTQERNAELISPPIIRKESPINNLDIGSSEDFVEQAEVWRNLTSSDEEQKILKEIQLLLTVLYPIKLDLKQIVSYLRVQSYTDIEEMVSLLLEKLKNHFPEWNQGYITLTEPFVTFLRIRYFSSLDFSRFIPKVFDWLMMMEAKQGEQPDWIDAISSLIAYWSNERYVSCKKLRKQVKGYTNYLCIQKHGAILYQIANLSKISEKKLGSFALNCLKRSAEVNYPPALKWLGECYFTGIDVPRNQEWGEKLIRRAASLGDEQAMIDLAIRLIHGTGVKKDWIEGEKWLRKSANTGAKDAMNRLGKFLIYDKKQCGSEGERWIRQAADQGCPQAMYELGILYLEKERKIKEGRHWLKLAAQNGDKDAMKELGICLLDGKWFQKRPMQGVSWLERAGEIGNSEAIIQLANRYFQGKGVKKNIKKGETWLRRFAEIGNEQVMVELGKELISGKYLQKNLQEGLFWLEKAAATHLNGLLELAHIYLYGEKRVRNRERGKWLLQKYAEMGHPQAMFKLGMLYLLGKGIARNVFLGEEWIRKAAKLGQVQAMLELGNRYLDGDGLAYSAEEGRYWLEQAALMGEKQAMYSLGKRYLFGMGFAQNSTKGLFWIKQAADFHHVEAMKILDNGWLSGITTNLKQKKRKKG